MPADETNTHTAAPDAPEAPARPAKTGPEVIAGYLKSLRHAPGVYRMLDADGTVLYVGKARSLKARVSNYARLGSHPNRILRMISLTASMEFITVRTEAEALLLEANLIKRFRPRFNVNMRDDKSFPYILIRRDHDAPQILKHRGARGAKGDYFGPFASAGAVNRTVNMLQRAFLLRSCSDPVYESRTRPCLLHQIKRCSAPCTGEIGLDEYNGLVDESVRFLRGESQNVRQHYQQLMEAAADKLEFERAARFRNRLWALAHVTADQSINPDGIEEADVFAAAQDGGQTCIEVFFFRTGQNWGNRAYFPKADRTLSVADVLDSFIAQFYDDKPVPRLILLSHEVPSRALLAEALSTKADRKVEIRVPQRGGKSGLVEHAVTNAREALGRRLAENSSQRQLLESLAQRFSLAAVPRRIEVYDNSHIMGANAVGALIVAGAQGFVKNQYRKFNIRSVELTPGDDYAMMREVLTRRFKRLVAEENAGTAREDGVGPSGSDAIPAIPEHESRLEEPVPITQRGADAVAFGVLRADATRFVSPSPLQGDRASFPSPRTSRGEGRGEGQPQTAAPVAAPHPNPLPTEEWGEGMLQLVGRVDEGDPTAAEDAATSPSGLATNSTRPTEITEALDDDAFPTKPDLILIDGGAGQLAVACEVLADLGISDVLPIGVAKGPDRDAGREHFHIPGRGKPIMLEPRDPVLYFVQRLRDEAHRFAIMAHRAKRTKAIGVNPLDEIAGIGPTRKRALLQHFGSAKAVSRAGVEDLKAVGGISAQMAQAIYDFFHEKRA